MLEPVKCRNCGKPFHYLAILNSLPTRLQCSHCQTRNAYDRGTLFAVIFYLCWLASVLALFGASSIFDIKLTPHHLHSLISYALFLGGVIISTLILSFIYLKSLEKWSRLEIRNR